jgi:succinoglycan biosynthesis protein ExoW
MPGSSDGKVSHLEAMRSIAAQLSIRRRSDRLGAEGQVGRPLASVGTIGSGNPLGDQGAIKESQKHSTQRVLGSPPRLAIIVPYFQREAGILRRCLASIFAQKMNSIIEMHVIVVDDASPQPAYEELTRIQIPEQISVDVITRINGGPGAARNSGLDHVPPATDFVAFIDSDDTWRDEHIQRAVDALGSSNDLYFSDYLQWGGFSHFDSKNFGAFVRMGQSSALQRFETVKGVRVFSNEDIIPYAVKEFVAHTSSIVYRRSKFSTCRFDEELRWAGEDDLFLLDLLFSSTQICVSTEIEVELGSGVNIFFSSFGWDSENNVKRLLCNFLAQKYIQRRYQLNSELHETVKRRIRSWSASLTFFIIRRVLKGKSVPLSLLLLLLRKEPLFFVAFPANIFRAAVEWASGKGHFDGERTFK